MTRLAWAGLGLAALVAAALLPAGGTALAAAGAGFLGLALPGTRAGLVRPRKRHRVRVVRPRAQ